jgi:hypothetical protein
MALSDLIGQSLDAPVAAIRRHVIFLAIAVAAGIGAVLYAASAGVVALEMALGPVLARALIAVVLALIAAAAYFAPRFFKARTPVEPPRPETESMTTDQRIAMVFEALLLGFSVGSRKPAESADGRK